MLQRLFNNSTLKQRKSLDPITNLSHSLKDNHHNLSEQKEKKQTVNELRIQMNKQAATDFCPEINIILNPQGDASQGAVLSTKFGTEGESSMDPSSKKAVTTRTSSPPSVSKQQHERNNCAQQEKNIIEPTKKIKFGWEDSDDNSFEDGELGKVTQPSWGKSKSHRPHPHEGYRHQYNREQRENGEFKQKQRKKTSQM